jgi:hypothetical protein
MGNGMSDVHFARGEAKDTVMESMAHVNLPTNGNKQYELDEFIKVLKVTQRVLTETYDELHSNGMSDLLEKYIKRHEQHQNDGHGQLQNSTKGVQGRGR